MTVYGCAAAAEHKHDGTVLIIYDVHAQTSDRHFYQIVEGLYTCVNDR
jgi:hypothetical protein